MPFKSIGVNRICKEERHGWYDKVIKYFNIKITSRQRVINSLKERQDIRILSVREDLQNALAVPSIDERVVAIERLLKVHFLALLAHYKVTNRAESVEETFKTLSWLLQRIRNEMKLNMDAIFNVIPRYRTSYFLEDVVSFEQAKEFVRVYNTFDNNVCQWNSHQTELYRFYQLFLFPSQPETSSETWQMMLSTILPPARHILFLHSVHLYLIPLLIIKGMDVIWRHTTHNLGREAAGREITIQFLNPSCRNRPDLELKNRKATWRGVELGQEWKAIDSNVPITHLNASSYAHHYGISSSRPV